MTDPTGQATYTYDTAGRVTAVSSPRGQITYTYDSAGRRASMTLPGNRTITYVYNARGLLSSLTDWQGRVTTFDYDSDGNRTKIIRPTGVESTYTYDSARHITSITHTKGATTLLSFAYTYDDAGRRTSVTTPEGTEGYTYDGLGRLTQVSYPGGPTVSYTYDAAGNRKTETRDGTTTNYDYDAAGQLLTVGNKTYTYDANGNLTQAGTDSFTWDFDNRLTQATVGSDTALYTYDGDGNRVGANVDGVSRSFLVDEQNGLATLVDDGSKAYLHADGVLGEVSSGSTTQLLADALGSVRGLADEAGSLIGSRAFDAFGMPRTSSGASSLFGFTGEPTDATGLVFLRARSLDPSTGRFLSADSVIPNAPGTQGYNLYAYAANNPTTWVDPTGHFLDNRTVWDVVRYLSATGVAGVASLAGALLALITAHPVAALVVVFLTVAAVLFYFLEVRPNEDLFQKLGSESEQGVFSQAIEDLLRAVDEFPYKPDTSRGCPSPQGTIGSYADLLRANAGQPHCNAHHIIQHASVRDVPGYSKYDAPAIVLIGPAIVPGTPHYYATQAQRAASVGGSYGAERQVAVAALRAAGMPASVVLASLEAADSYFTGDLGLTYDSALRVPGDRWGYGR